MHSHDKQGFMHELLHAVAMANTALHKLGSRIPIIPSSFTQLRLDEAPQSVAHLIGKAHLFMLQQLSVQEAEAAQVLEPSQRCHVLRHLHHEHVVSCLHA